MTSRPVEAVPVDDDEFIAVLVAAGIPDGAAAWIASFGRAIREGVLSVVTSTVQDLTGRPPRTVREVLTEHRDELLGG